LETEVLSRFFAMIGTCRFADQNKPTATQPMPDVDRRLLLRHPLGAPSVRGSPTFSKNHHGRFRDSDLFRHCGIAKFRGPPICVEAFTVDEIAGICPAWFR
jgi:hypothetical protein